MFEKIPIELIFYVLNYAVSERAQTYSITHTIFASEILLNVKKIDGADFF